MARDGDDFGTFFTMTDVGNFAGNKVLEWTPLTFAVEFIKRMRIENDHLLNIPSTRQAIAIPKFLFARYYRKATLVHEDYIAAAVNTTPVEDQAIAHAVAFDILFPKPPVAETLGLGSGSGTHGKVKDAVPGKKQPRSLDEVLADMQLYGMDCNEVDDDEIDDFLDDSLSELEQLARFLEEFNNKASGGEEPYHSLREFIEQHGGIPGLMAKNPTSLGSVQDYVKATVQRDMDAFTARDVKDAVTAGFGDMISSNAKAPWVRMAAEYIANAARAMQDLEAMLDQGDVASTARALQYMKEMGLDAGSITRLTSGLVSKARDLLDLLEISRAMGSVPQFDQQSMFQKSLDLDVNSAFQAARNMDAEFGGSITGDLFAEWARSADAPSIDDLFEAQADLQAWRDMLESVVSADLAAMPGNGGAMTSRLGLAEALMRQASGAPVDACSQAFQDMAARVASSAIEAAKTKEEFITAMQNILAKGIPVSEDDAIANGRRVQLSDDAIMELMGGNYKLLKKLVETGIGEYTRYARMLAKIGTLTSQQMQELMQAAMASGNKQAMGAIGLHDMGMALDVAKALGPGALQDLAGSLTAGPGDNLLKEWFTHRRNIPAEVKEYIRKLTREALMRIALRILARQRGTGEKGLIPSSRLRSYIDGDELDLIDIDASIENIVMAGKRPEHFTSDDLLVQETQKGRVAFAFLLDISGSMTGAKLASCAISVVILVGKLSANEVAVALFESDTHKLKEFTDDKDIEGLVDELLDLQARGGTQAGAALQWASDQLKENEAEKKLCMVLTDCCFSESFEQIRPILDEFNTSKTRFMVVVDNSHSEDMLKRMVNYTRGESIKIPRVTDIPGILSDALDKID